MVGAETKELNEKRVSPITDVEAKLENEEYRSRAIALGELLDDRADNINERETIQKEFDGRIPEWRSVNNKSKSFLLRRALGDFTGLDIFNPNEWKEGDGKILSDEKRVVQNTKDVIANAKAVEIEELTGTEYQLVQGEENRYENSVDGKWFYDYLSTRKRSFFHNFAIEYDEETDRTIFETDLIFRWPRHELLEEVNFEDLDIWRFTGILNGEPEENLDFVMRSNPESEKEKVEEYFGEETYELFEEAGFLEEKEIWEPDLVTKKISHRERGVKTGDMEKYNNEDGYVDRHDAEEIEPFYARNEPLILEVLEDIFSVIDEVEAYLDGEKVAINEEEIYEIFEEKFTDIDEKEEYLTWEHVEGRTGGKIVIDKGDIQKVKYRIPCVSYYAGKGYTEYTEEGFPETEGKSRPQRIESIDLEEPEHQLEINYRIKD